VPQLVAQVVAQVVARHLFSTGKPGDKHRRLAL
jgi:hypothetical protein